MCTSLEAHASRLCGRTLWSEMACCSSSAADGADPSARLCARFAICGTVRRGKALAHRNSPSTRLPYDLHRLQVHLLKALAPLRLPA